ncbi:MAG: ankyrin repeat domain-containing protein [Epsilonproteobacteria bacterium]|nr:ankyrin repeat domain-containing protein [Campylobacterota bacterium]
MKKQFFIVFLLSLCTGQLAAMGFGPENMGKFNRALADGDQNAFNLLNNLLAGRVTIVGDPNPSGIPGGTTLGYVDAVLTGKLGTELIGDDLRVQVLANELRQEKPRVEVLTYFAQYVTETEKPTMVDKALSAAITPQKPRIVPPATIWADALAQLSEQERVEAQENIRSWVSDLAADSPEDKAVSDLLVRAIEKSDKKKENKKYDSFSRFLLEGGAEPKITTSDTKLRNKIVALREQYRKAPAKPAGVVTPDPEQGRPAPVQPEPDSAKRSDLSDKRALELFRGLRNDDSQAIAELRALMSSPSQLENDYAKMIVSGEYVSVMLKSEQRIMEKFKTGHTGMSEEEQKRRKAFIKELEREMEQGVDLRSKLPEIMREPEVDRPQEFVGIGKVVRQPIVFADSGPEPEREKKLNELLSQDLMERIRTGADLSDEDLGVLRTLAREQSIDVIDEYGKTLLDYAIERDDLNLVDIALQGVDPNYKDTDNKTPLYRAVEQGKYEMVQRLLANPDLDVNQLSTDSNKTALHIAVEQGYSGIFNLLLEDERVDTSIKDVKKKTAMKIIDEKIEAASKRGDADAHERLKQMRKDLKTTIAADKAVKSAERKERWSQKLDALFHPFRKKREREERASLLDEQGQARSVTGQIEEDVEPAKKKRKLWIPKKSKKRKFMQLIDDEEDDEPFRTFDESERMVVDEPETKRVPVEPVEEKRVISGGVKVLPTLPAARVSQFGGAARLP